MSWRTADMASTSYRARFAAASPDDIASLLRPGSGARIVHAERSFRCWSFVRNTHAVRRFSPHASFKFTVTKGSKKFRPDDEGAGRACRS
jgi:hypothetical protein